MKTVTGIGQASWDYLGLVDGYPSGDTKKEVLRWEEQGGGPVATALVTLQRLGVQTRFHGVVGDDREGDRIRESLTDEGVDVSGLRIREGSASQVAFIVIEQGSGKRTIFWRRPTGPPLEPEEAGALFLEGADFLLLDGLMAEVSIHAARKARSEGVPVMIDAGRVREGMLELARLSDYVVGSEEFARDLGFDGDIDAFRHLLWKEGFPVTTITLGERGSITFNNDEVFRTEAFRVDVVDTTGAGDVFHGGYIYGLLEGWELRKTVIFASALSALKCRFMGGRRGIASLSEVMEFLRERNAPFFSSP